MSRRGLSPRRRASILAACAVGAAFYRLPEPARAVVRRDDVPDSSYIALGNLSAYAAVGIVNESTGFGGGILISPKWVLSAGHVIAAGPSTFTFGAAVAGSGGTSLGVNQYFTAPGQDTGNVANGMDIGLLQVNGIVTGITPATRYFGPDEIGMLGTYVGYGQSGTGSNGTVSSSEGTKRAFTNMMDLDSGSVSNLPNSNLVLADFDAPFNDGYNAMGMATPTALEGSLAFFDSGGGVFANINGRNYLTATNSFVGDFGNGLDDGVISSGYSDTSWATRVLPFNEWIDNSIDNNWKTAADGSFGTAGNWSVGTFTTGTPGTGDIAGFNIAGTYTVTLGGAVSNHQLLVRQGNVTLNLGGFTYHLTSTMSEGGVVVGRYADNVASLTFSTGTVTSDGDVIVGHLSGSTGQVSIGPSAVWNVAGDMYVGGSFDGPGGTGTVNLQNSTSSLSVAGTLRVFGGGVLNYNAGSLSVGTLDVYTGRVNLAAGANKLLRAKAVTISVASGGKIDLTDNDMVIDYTGSSPLSTIQSYITSGYNGGNWGGFGITSSKAATSPNGGEAGKTAIGYGEASTLHIGTFDGVTVDSTALLVKYTYRGDANLDGKVDMSDLYLLAQNWLTSNQTWTGGDFNYDGTVNAKDLGLLALNWQAGATTGALSQPLNLAAFGLTPGDFSAVPEPVGMAGMLLLTYSLKRRHRAQRNSPTELSPRSPAASGGAE